MRTSWPWRRAVDHSLGLKADGSIVAWGGNDDGQCNVPAPNTDFVAVAAGATSQPGLKADGSIVAWGATARASATCPAPNTDFVAVAAGVAHSLGLKADGSIVAWGDDDRPVQRAGAEHGLRGRRGGLGHSLGLKADGSIVAWGATTRASATCRRRMRTSWLWRAAGLTVWA